MAKGKIGGKREVVPSEFSDKDAGTKREMKRETAGTKREFEGSHSKKYVFEDKVHGTHEFVAISYQDALRQAKALGFTIGDYVGVNGKKKRGKRGK